MKTLKPLGVLLLLLLFCFACNSGPGRDAQARSGPSGVPEDREAKALEIILSEGKPVDPDTAERPVVTGTPLSQARIDQILKMFTEPLETEKDKPEFLKRPGSKPAPRSVTPKEIPFPPTGEGDPPPEVKGQSLQVL